jgi:CMP-N-acetylneuraminic acid synthetase
MSVSEHLIVLPIRYEDLLTHKQVLHSSSALSAPYCISNAFVKYSLNCHESILSAVDLEDC